MWIVNVSCCNVDFSGPMISLASPGQWRAQAPALYATVPPGSTDIHCLMTLLCTYEAPERDRNAVDGADLSLAHSCLLMPVSVGAGHAMWVDSCIVAVALVSVPGAGLLRFFV